jgi:GTP-binding protein Era
MTSSDPEPVLAATEADPTLTDVSDSVSVTEPPNASHGPAEPGESSFRSGFACIVGRPNAGKSTLVNALVGSKIVIASDKPQTTRHVVRGIVNRPDAQLILIDTPGLHRPRTLLGQRLNDLVAENLPQVDVVAICLPADQRIGPGDRHVITSMTKLSRRPVLVAVATKSDLVSKNRMVEHLVRIGELETELGISWSHIVPVSAVAGERLDELADAVTEALPPGPKLYTGDDISDQPEERLVAELIREAALDGVRDELPHSIAVELDEFGLRPDRAPEHPLLDIYASLIVERESQKGIVIGRRGNRLKQVGQVARHQIEGLLGTPAYLNLQVKVLKDWQRDPKHLNRLGF